MDFFRAEKIGVYESNSYSLRECLLCNNKMRLIRVVHYPEIDETIRVFECDCGARAWDD
jgi:hypothetical protein